MMKTHKTPEKWKGITSVLDLHHRFICRLQPDRSKVNPPPCVIIVSYYIQFPYGDK